MLLPPNAPIAADAKLIRESWAALSLLIRDPKQGSAVHDVGKLVEIWKKQADGKWKCIVDTYNSDLPVTAASEKK